MKSVRVVFALVALLALPFGSAVAQGRGKDKPRAQSSAESECKPEHRAALERARAEGRSAPPGLDKKCPDAPPAPPPPPPPPPPANPPTGIHRAKGTVYEDVDGDGMQNMFAGELGLAGWTVQLYWDGRLISSMQTDDMGGYDFPNLGNSWWVICVVPQAGYVRTEPASGDACNGDGRRFELNSPFESWGGGNYGYRIQ